MTAQAKYRSMGYRDASYGVNIPPNECCERTQKSELMRQAWIEGWKKWKEDKKKSTIKP